MHFLLPIDQFNSSVDTHWNVGNTESSAANGRGLHEHIWVPSWHYFRAVIGTPATAVTLRTKKGHDYKKGRQQNIRQVFCSFQMPFIIGYQNNSQAFN